MTSSLVGSEMCIRDRSITAGGEDPHNITEAPNAPTQTWEEECESTEEAVSYTHLTLPTICSV
eukprot:692812-Prorocentrum_lima.AAC.1